MSNYLIVTLKRDQLFEGHNPAAEEEITKSLETLKAYGARFALAGGIAEPGDRRGSWKQQDPRFIGTITAFPDWSNRRLSQHMSMLGLNVDHAIVGRAKRTLLGMESAKPARKRKGKTTGKTNGKRKRQVKREDPQSKDLDCCLFFKDWTHKIIE